MLKADDLLRIAWEYCVLKRTWCALHRTRSSVQIDDVGVGVLDDILHKQTLEQFEQYMILAAKCEVILGLLQLFGCRYMVAVMTFLFQFREGLPTRLKTRFYTGEESFYINDRL